MFGALVYAGFAVLLFLFLSLTIYAFMQIHVAASGYQDQVNNNHAQTNLILAMRVAFRERELLLSQMSEEPDAVERTSLYEQFMAHGADFLNARIALDETDLSRKDGIFLSYLDDEVNPRSATMRSLSEHLLEKQAGQEENRQLYQTLTRQHGVAKELDRLIQLQQTEIEQDSQATQETVEGIMINLIIAMLVIILLGILFIWYVIRSASQQLKQLQTVQYQLAAGNRVLHMMTEELSLANEELEHIAHHDLLTGLPNRRYMMDQFELMLAVAKRHHHTGALLFIDLDGFKQINDNFGHNIGDEFLKVVANAVKEELRESDLVARMGGDEFIVVLQNIKHKNSGIVVVEKLLASLNRAYELKGHQVQASGSIGISYFPDGEADVEELLQRADAAMYLAKLDGKNCYAVHRS